MVAFTRFFERVDRHGGVLARIDFGDLGGEIAASAVGVFAHQHVDARSRLGHVSKRRCDRRSTSERERKTTCTVRSIRTPAAT